MKNLNHNTLKQIKAEIRKRKISNILETNQNPLIFDINNISWERREIIKHFSKFGAITGSNLYILYGLISRMPNDIDLLVDAEGLLKLKDTYEIIKGDFYTFELINSIGYIRYEINNKTYQIDVILTDDISYTKFIDDIRIDDIFKSIQMKINMYEKNEERNPFKDELDLNEMLSYFKGEISYTNKLKTELDNLDLSNKPFLNKLKDFFTTNYKKS